MNEFEEVLFNCIEKCTLQPNKHFQAVKLNVVVSEKNIQQKSFRL